MFVFRLRKRPFASAGPGPVARSVWGTWPRLRHSCCLFEQRARSSRSVTSFVHMPLFDVPGWSVPGAPTPDSHTSKKRKRPASDGDANKLETAHINFEKLMEKLEASDPTPAGSKKQKKERERQRDDIRPRHSAELTQKGISGVKSKGKKPVQEKVASEQAKTPSKRNRDVGHEGRNADSRLLKPPKKKRNTQQPDHPGTPAHESGIAGDTKPPPQDQKLTKLQAGLKNSLNGARFRCELRGARQISYSSPSQLDK